MTLILILIAVLLLILLLFDLCKRVNNLEIQLLITKAEVEHLKIICQEFDTNGGDENG